MWQCLVGADGTTCPRYGSTRSAIERAVTSLAEVLRPFGIVPSLETREIDQATFDAVPGESNRTWVAVRPMEDWIGATAGSSQCCSVCGTARC